MRVESVKQQNFGANPSNLIRRSLALASMDGKDVSELIQLIKEVQPRSFMTMLEEKGKVFSVGITPRFDATAKRVIGYNPEFLKGIEAFENKHKVNDPFSPYGWSILPKYKEKYHKLRTDLRQKYPDVVELREPENYTSLYRDEKGSKSFTDIVDTLSTAIKKVINGQDAYVREYNKVDGQFPPYQVFATARDMASVERRLPWRCTI